MSEAATAEGPSSSQSADPDLSAEIAGSIERKLGEQVTCRRVSGRKYRCNWWSPKSTSAYDNPRMDGLVVTTHVVIRSRFLTACRDERGLVISDIPAPSTDKT
jgi:hypothetical protein